ncbi:MAG: HD domain-containing protein [Deltaproteobacteria bacterium]|nr:HD domain-containing protein [Deltaproteobacteria bacterium]MBT4527174.1 HD domain-containing protein [Deltaproteobacteria bacterium]
MTTINILIADKESSTVNLMAAVLEKFGHQVYTAETGTQAREIYNEVDIDIIVAGVNLPIIHGVELIQQIQAVSPKNICYILTGSSKDYSYDDLLASGAQEYIKQPFTKEELKAIFRRIIHEFCLESENKQLRQIRIDLTDKLRALMTVAMDLTSELDFNSLFPIIIEKATDAMSAERTSLYMIDWEKNEIWTRVAQDVKPIRLPMGAGISGKVAENGEIINVADAWKLDYFNRDFDIKNNFRTKSVLCAPITSRNGKRLGVLQVINKKNKIRFDDEDEAYINSLSAQIGIALENSFLHEELRVSFEHSVLALSATVDAKHPLTAGHSQRVTEYSLIISRELGLDKEQMEIIKYAALLHDIGKIGIQDSVLLKNGPFNEEERLAMQQHSTKTLKILHEFHFSQALHDVPEIAAYHHEKLDGTGYTEGLKGDQIPFGSRILAVADVFDALTSKRDYPKYTENDELGNMPMPLEKVIKILQSGAGSHFDPNVVDAFLRCLPETLLLYRGNHFEESYVDEMIYEYSTNIDG